MAFHCVGTGVPWVSLPGPTSVPSYVQARWHREHSANFECAVGASPVSSALANVFGELVQTNCDSRVL